MKRKLPLLIFLEWLKRVSPWRKFFFGKNNYLIWLIIKIKPSTNRCSKNQIRNEPTQGWNQTTILEEAQQEIYSSENKKMRHLQLSTISTILTLWIKISLKDSRILQTLQSAILKRKRKLLNWHIKSIAITKRLRKIEIKRSGYAIIRGLKCQATKWLLTIWQQRNLWALRQSK